MWHFGASSYAQLLYEEPVKLGDGVNSTAEETMPLVSTDGSILYFSRILYGENVGGETAGQDIWYAKGGEEGSWTESKNDLNKLNNKFDNAIVGIGEDGKTYYLLNSYKKKGKMGVSVTTLENRIWSVPSSLDIPGLESLSGLYGFYMHPSGDILMISMEGADSFGKEDIYVSVKGDDGKWSEPINLGATINSEAFEITPFLDEETDNLYFSTDGRDGLGSADIYVSERMDDTWTNWTSPANLKEPINSAGFDAFFSLNASGDVFFSSNRGSELNDIYYSKIVEAKAETASQPEPLRAQEEAQSAESQIFYVQTSAPVNTEEETTQESAPSASASESVADVMNQILSEESVDDTEAEYTQIYEALGTVEAEDPSDDADAQAVTKTATITSQDEEDTTPVTSVENEESEIAVQMDDEQEAQTLAETTSDDVERVEDSAIEELVATELPFAEEEEMASDVVENIDTEQSDATQESELPIEPDVASEVLEEPEETPEVVLEEIAEEVVSKPIAASSSPVLASGATERIYFEHNSSYLGEKAQQQLVELSKRLSSIMSTNKIEVIGYSDNTGEQHYNLWITERRANRVIAFLAENGVESSVFVADWKGAENQYKQCSSCTEQENEANRRVEIIVR
ncbi:MAG: hypothetical protein COB85_01495 [Bacteroidetes bacterium]|nr:MAG: hypothetical protein COB85_01495 [Bacteroidota bacterium]